MSPLNSHRPGEWQKIHSAISILNSYRNSVLKYSVLPLHNKTRDDRARIFFPRTNAENYLHTFVLERKNNPIRALCIKHVGASGNTLFVVPRHVDIVLYTKHGSGIFPTAVCCVCKNVSRRANWYPVCAAELVLDMWACFVHKSLFANTANSCVCSVKYLCTTVFHYKGIYTKILMD